MIFVLAGIIDSDYQGEIELLLHRGGKQSSVWNTNGITGVPLSIPMPYD